MSELWVAEVPEIGLIRFAEQDGQNYYVGRDVLKAMGVMPKSNGVRKMLEDHCKDVRVINCNRDLICIPSDDVYRLLARFNLLDIEKFRNMLSFPPLRMDLPNIEIQTEQKRLRLISSDALAKRNGRPSDTVVISIFYLQSKKSDFGEFFYLDRKDGKRICYLNSNQLNQLIDHKHIASLEYSKDFILTPLAGLKLSKMPESVQEPEPESVQEPEPETVQEPEPESVQEPEPETVQVMEPVIVNQNESWVNDVPGLEEVRSFLRDGERWFIGGDVTKALGYSGVSDTLKQHCKCVKLFPIKTNGGTQKVLTIPGGEVYRLITRSDLLSTEPAKEYFYSLLWSLTEKPDEKQEATKPESVQEPEVANDSWGIDALGTEKMRFEILLESVESNLNKTMRDFGILNAFYWFSLVLLLAFVTSKLF